MTDRAPQGWVTGPAHPPHVPPHPCTAGARSLRSLVGPAGGLFSVVGRVYYPGIPTQYTHPARTQDPIPDSTHSRTALLGDTADSQF